VTIGTRGDRDFAAITNDRALRATEGLLEALLSAFARLAVGRKPRLRARNRSTDVILEARGHHRDYLVHHCLKVLPVREVGLGTGRSEEVLVPLLRGSSEERGGDDRLPLLLADEGVEQSEARVLFVRRRADMTI